MFTTLVRQTSGHYSLELDPTDLEPVGSFIRTHFPKVEKIQYPTCAVYSFGGCSFAFQNQWDDPCLISGSDDGDRLLEQIFAHLTGDARLAAL